jgi:glutathione S-transferase
MLKLLCTGGSPFSRKVRIVLAEKGLEYEADKGSASKRPAEVFGLQNPNLAVPVLIDGETTIFESNLILEYLLSRYPATSPAHESPPLADRLTRSSHHWEDAKILATLEAMADIVVNMRFFKSSGVDVENLAYGKRQRTLFRTCLDWLESRATPEGFIPGMFSIQDINLICPLDYLDARGDILKGALEWRQGHPRLEAIVTRYRERPSVKSTTPGPAENANYAAVN